MPFDSEGTFTRMHNWEDDRVNDIEIVSDSHDEEDNNFADGLSQTLLRDGRVSMTGHLNLAAFQIKNVGNGTFDTDAVNKGQLETVNTALTEALTAVDESVVHLAEDETITGVKTFETSPKVPNAAAESDDTTAANTAWVRAQGRPNYKSGTSITFPYTAADNGFIIGDVYLADEGTSNFIVNDVTISHIYNEHQSHHFIYFAVDKGDVVNITGGTKTIKFYPMK